MTSRVLPLHEWPRLAHTLLSGTWEKLPTSSIIVVVEDATGAIVACSALFQAWHQEGTWVSDAYRGNAAVGRSLVRAMRQALDVMNVSEVCMMATNDESAALCQKFGRAISMTAQHFAVTVSEGQASWQIQ